jgi:hypothetical protein
MRLEDAPSMSFTAEDEEPEKCEICGTEEPYVKYDNNKTCKCCGHLPNHSTSDDDNSNPWQSWWEHRADMYSGFYGKDRVKMVGGFSSAWNEFDF